MQRESTQHSPRIDEMLARETESLTRGAPVESRAEEARASEAPGDGEPVPDARTTETEIEQRSRLAVALRPRAFPADRRVLLAVAEEEHADPDVVTWLRSLPADRVFVNVQAVWAALGGAVESRRLTRRRSDPRAR